MMKSPHAAAAQPYAIVIGLDDGTNGIQTARILAQRNVPVIAIAGDPSHYCCRTKVCEQILFANTKNDDFIEKLKELGPRLAQKAVLFPCQDANVMQISRYREELMPWYHIMLPDPAIIDMMTDKISFYTYAQREGFPIPPTFFLHSREDAKQAGAALTFPCVLKPHLRTPEWNHRTNFKAFKVAGAKELLALYDQYGQWAEAMIAQEWIPGGDRNHFSCNLYMDDVSEPLVVFTSRKLRQWPPQTGQGCLGEESRNDDVMHETIRLFRHVGHRGLGYLEMKCDERTGRYLIIEPNIGRPTGRSATAEADGVELLYTMYCDAIGWPLPDSRTQQNSGVKWIYLRQDLQAAIHHWRRGELSFAAWWHSWRGCKTYALFSWRDPGPFFGDLWRVLRVLLSPDERRKRNYENPLDS